MGCSSCGGASAMPAPSLLASANQANTAGKWKVTFPSGNSREFPSEWQANASQAVGGGTVEYIAPEEPVAKSTAATTTRSAPKPSAPSTRSTATKTTVAKVKAPRKTAKRPRAGTSDAPVEPVEVMVETDGGATDQDSGDNGGGD